ncbi:hypothetical protein NFI96_013027 [Prochilodus magdalenae]|nr:hypothetical protein NFI96_013027 [Prochilodus magdalenae]
MYTGLWAWLLVLALHSGMVKCMAPIQANCNDNVRLPCTVREHQDKYRYIIWYRNNTAIIKRKNNSMTFYNKSSPASLGEGEALVLQQVKPYDSGQYQCFLAADIGGKDIESHVLLSVSECTTMHPTTTCVPNMCHYDMVEIPALWAVLPFILFCLFKVGLCFISILVCQKIRGSEGDRKGRRSSRKLSQCYS